MAHSTKGIVLGEIPNGYLLRLWQYHLWSKSTIAKKCWMEQESLRRPSCLDLALGVTSLGRNRSSLHFHKWRNKVIHSTGCCRISLISNIRSYCSTVMPPLFSNRNNWHFVWDWGTERNKSFGWVSLPEARATVSLLRIWQMFKSSGFYLRWKHVRSWIWREELTRRSFESEKRVWLQLVLRCFPHIWYCQSLNR